MPAEGYSGALRSKVRKTDLLALKPPDDASDSSTDIPSSPSAIKRFSIAGSASDDLTESEKMRSLVQIFRRSPSTVEPVGNCPLPTAGNAVAPDHLAAGEK